MTFVHWGRFRLFGCVSFVGRGGRDLLVWECVGCWWWCDTATLKTGATAQIPSHILFLTHLFCADSLLSAFQENALIFVVTGFVLNSNVVSSAFMMIFDHAYHPSPHPPIHPASLPLPDINWWHLVPSSASRLSCPTPTHAGGSKYIFADVSKPWASWKGFD